MERTKQRKKESLTSWTSGSSWKGLVYEIGSVCLPVHRPLYPSRIFLGTGSLFCLNFSMLLETLMKLCVTHSFFGGKKNPRKWESWAISKVFWIYWEISSWIFPQLGLWWKFILFVIFQHESHIWENSSPWDKGQNNRGYSDCKIFKSAISQEQNDEIVWFFSCQYKFMQMKGWLKFFLVCMVRNGCGHFGHRTLSLTLFQEGVDGMYWFFCMLIHIQEI